MDPFPSRLAHANCRSLHVRKDAAGTRPIDELFVLCPGQMPVAATDVKERYFAVFTKVRLSFFTPHRCLLEVVNVRQSNRAHALLAGLAAPLTVSFDVAFVMCMQHLESEQQ